MHTRILAAVLVLGSWSAFATADARAQGQSTNSSSALLGGVSPSRIQMRTINTSNVVGNVPVKIYDGSATSNSSFSLSRILTRPFVSLTRRLGSSPLPPPSSFQSTKYPNSFQPVAPTTMRVR